MFRNIQEGLRVIFYFGFKELGLYKFELNYENYKELKLSNIGCRFRENKKSILKFLLKFLNLFL